LKINFFVKAKFIIIILLVFFTNKNLYAQLIPDQKFKKLKTVYLVDGYANFNAVNASQNNFYNKNLLSDNITENRIDRYSLNNDTQIYFKSGYQFNNDVKIGVVIKSEFNYSTNKIKESPNIDQAFIYSQSDFGRLEFGNYQAVNQKMKFGPSRIARGSGGINGKYLQYVNLPMLASSANSSSPLCNQFGSGSCLNLKMPRFITLAQSPIGHGGYAKGFYQRGVNNNFDSTNSAYSAYNRSNFRSFKDDSYEGIEDALKLNYYSPKINGFQYGLSYAYDSDYNGLSANTAYDVDDIHLKNILAIGLNYAEDFDNFSLAISSTAEKAQIENSASKLGVERNDLLAYDLGIMVSYFGFKIAGSYGNWLRSLQAKNGVYSCQYNQNLELSSQDCSISVKKFKNPSYYTLGLSYQFGPFFASLTNLKSNFQKNYYNATSLGIDFKYSKNLIPYLEITNFNFKLNQPIASNLINQTSLDNQAWQFKNNGGNIFLIGFLYSF